MNGKEWEEEQVRLDRDWYSYDDEGAVVSFQACDVHLILKIRLVMRSIILSHNGKTWKPAKRRNCSRRS